MRCADGATGPPRIDPMNPSPNTDPQTPVDVTRKFVRVTQVRADGLVAFEFSIGWPELAAELVLPRAAFNEFCATHQVQRLDDEALTGAPHRPA
jgi:phenol/toluene 2-monooxygenase (NADH) P0/A0